MKPPRSAAPFLFLLAILFLAASGHAVLQCAENLAGGTTILRLSGQTNAHGESTSHIPAGYTLHEIRCRETTGVLVGPGQSNPVTLMRLSSTTNAHGEEPGQPMGYTIPIAMGDNSITGTINVRVRNTALGQTCANIGASFPYTEVVRLSSLTNAHMEIPGLTNYPIIICAGYDPTGGAGPYVPEDLVQIDPLTHNLPGASPPAIPNPPLSSNNPGTITVPMRDMVFGSAGYDEMTTLQISGICDMADVACQNIVPTGAGYDNVEGEITNFIATGATFIVPGSMRVNKYGSGTAFDTIYTDLTLTQGIPGQFFPTNLEDLPSAVTSYQYNFTPAALNMTPGSTYKFFTISYRAEFDYTLSSPAIVNGIEEVSYRRNNIQTFVFDVTAPTTPPVTGTAGDVYVLKDLVVPNTFRSGTVFAEVTIENRNTALPQSENVTVSVLIRDSKGTKVIGFDPAIIPATLTVPGATTVITIPLQPPCGATTGTVCTFNEGETYAIYATVQPYVDGTPVPFDESETFTANNNGFKTFTSFEPPQAVSIPDFPAWMSMFTLSIVLGWLFFSARKEK